MKPEVLDWIDERVSRLQQTIMNAAYLIVAAITTAVAIAAIF